MTRRLLIAAAGFSLTLAAAPLAAQELTAEGSADQRSEQSAEQAAETIVAQISADLDADEEVDVTSEGTPAEEFIFLTEEEEELANFEEEITAAFGMLSEIFKVEPLTAEQQARLPLGQEMARSIMPEGSFGAAMNETMEPMMTMIMGTVTNDPRIRLAEISGVTTDELAELEDTAAQEALDIFDPQYAARTQRTSDVMVSMVTKLLEAVEPAYRDAMAHALAVRFEEGEMRELLAFFATPVGGKFAAQSFLVQYDSRMLGVMEAMGPAFVQIMPELIEEVTAIEVEFGSSRDFTELSATERARAARLIGKSVSELDALVPEITEDEGEGEEPVA
jgi:Uncharacterized protein conserved in bacteria (DUF2059)